MLVLSVTGSDSFVPLYLRASSMMAEALAKRSDLGT